MIGYVSITPSRVRLLVKALEDVGAASDRLRTRVRNLIQQGTEAGGSPAPLVRETMPFGSGASSELRDLTVSTRQSAQSYTRLRPSTGKVG
ncbi:hypothetical protein HPO96_30820 [Kribbella sandramycini]|uniref:Uncharacterized protein n=1 Tax=Kribbella sandramycini TaxID=60450 RepID=A0A7Y4L5C0_9ACTN|nr:hypothetical protein [Kribbella sandramycini]MBB6566928.1 hypothetical protein [Kribbella sandramycini]NOL44650.1 hypothetical protein [Kribbella sandramycini]